MYQRSFEEGGDKSAVPVIAEFYVDAVHMKAASEEAGRPIYKDYEFVRINVPGDAKTEIVQRVTDEHKNRFARQYDAFKRGVEQATEGTPLEQYPPMQPSQIRMLKALNIPTVEALAGLENNDAKIQELGLGGREMVKSAVAYLAVAADSAEAQKYAIENERMKSEIDDLKTQVQELAKMAEDAPKRRGRPPKDKEPENVEDSFS